MGEHTEKLFKTEQGRDTHLERKGVGILPGEEECSKDVGQATYIEQFFPVFVCLWPNIQFLFPPLTCSRTIPNMHVQLFSKVDSSPEAYGGGGEGGGIFKCPQETKPGYLPSFCYFSLEVQTGGFL